MTNVVKFLITRSFFQLGAELKREKFNSNNDRSANQQLWIAFFITFLFFLWAVYALIRYQSVLPWWVVVIGILLLFAPGGPLLTLILVYYTIGVGKGRPVETDVTETVTISEDAPTAYVSSETGGERPLRKRPHSRHYQGHSHSHSHRRPGHSISHRPPPHYNNKKGRPGLARHPYS